MSDREAEIQPTSNQKLQAILSYIGELRAQQEAQFSTTTSTPRTMQNPHNLEPQPPIQQPNPPNPNVVDLPKTLKELAAPTLD